MIDNDSRQTSSRRGIRPKTIIPSIVPSISLYPCTMQRYECLIFWKQQLITYQKSHLYSNQLNHFMTFKNKVSVPFCTPVVKGVTDDDVESHRKRTFLKVRSIYLPYPSRFCLPFQQRKGNDKNFSKVCLAYHR